MIETTNHIVIDCPNEEEGYELFEDIQNRFRIYDNCVIETKDVTKEDIGTQVVEALDGKGLACKIIIEGKNLGEILNLSKNLLEKYVKELKIISYVPIEESIIDTDRREETGGLEV